MPIARHRQTFRPNPPHELKLDKHIRCCAQSHKIYLTRLAFEVLVVNDPHTAETSKNIITFTSRRQLEAEPGKAAGNVQFVEARLFSQVRDAHRAKPARPAA